MTPAQALPAVLAKIDAELDNSLERLFEFLKIQSISTDPAFKEQCRAGADFMARELSGLGLDTSVRPTAGHPVVVGKSSTGGSGRRRASCSTAITTYSRLIRSTCGRRRRLRRALRRFPMGARSSSPAAPAMTKGKS